MPANTKMPNFFIHASNCICEGCKYKHGELLARRSTQRGLCSTQMPACVKLQVDCLRVRVKIELDHGLINSPLMSALGQKQTYAMQKTMSALPLKADMCGALAHVRFGPIADMALPHSVMTSCRQKRRFRVGSYQ